MPIHLDIVMGLVIGIGLSAACGFRVFVPLLGLSAAGLSGHLALAPGFEWIGTWPALAAFATATVLEVGAYYIPWLDHFLDTVASPAAILAGTLTTASLLGTTDPFLKWSLAIIAGGGAAGLVQAGTVALRTLSGILTAGLGNFLVSTGELMAAILFTFLAIIIPALALVLALWTLALAIMKWRQWRRQSPAGNNVPTPPGRRP